ncbi:MAG: DUF6171 family protein [Gammaproteobacteria bacterium]|nr:DUF6171 family protein [Gammaproteobacteria bacterium]MDH3467955.1 DUF6171 family protein [Gammaproteobacteria bacterium]
MSDNISESGQSWMDEFKDGLRWLKKSKEYVIVPRSTYKERYDICNSCDSFEQLTKQCRECACFMPLKTRMNITACPRGFWGLV